jgi:hypothetical protein
MDVISPKGHADRMQTILHALFVAFTDAKAAMGRRTAEDIINGLVSEFKDKIKGATK